MKKAEISDLVHDAEENDEVDGADGIGGNGVCGGGAMGGGQSCEMAGGARRRLELALDKREEERCGRDGETDGCVGLLPGNSMQLRSILCRGR